MEALRGTLDCSQHLAPNKLITEKQEASSNMPMAEVEAVRCKCLGTSSTFGKWDLYQWIIIAVESLDIPVTADLSLGMYLVPVEEVVEKLVAMIKSMVVRLPFGAILVSYVLSNCPHYSLVSYDRSSYSSYVFGLQYLANNWIQVAPDPFLDYFLFYYF